MVYETRRSQLCAFHSPAEGDFEHNCDTTTMIVSHPKVWSGNSNRHAWPRLFFHPQRGWHGLRVSFLLLPEIRHDEDLKIIAVFLRIDQRLAIRR